MLFNNMHNLLKKIDQKRPFKQVSARCDQACKVDDSGNTQQESISHIGTVQSTVNSVLTGIQPF